jgi:uncharacterized protein YwgA
MTPAVSPRLRWLLVIIKLSQYVEGSTRLQKLAFLAHEQVKELAQHEFYNDWFPSKYGPMSRDLADDVKANTGQTIMKSQIRNDAGFMVDCFSLSTDGDSVADATIKESPKIRNKIEAITAHYSKAPLMSLLHDVYYQYPQFATASTIRSTVVGKTGSAGTSLDPEFDDSSD